MSLSDSTTKYVPSSISWVSMPMMARLDAIWASSRNARCRLGDRGVHQVGERGNVRRDCQPIRELCHADSLRGRPRSRSLRTSAVAATLLGFVAPQHSPEGAAPGRV